MPDPMLRRLLTEDETADYINVKKETLTTWRCTQRYALPYIRVGRAIRYRISDVEKFLAERTVSMANAADNKGTD
jgi:excisionase family DNA binding protein